MLRLVVPGARTYHRGVLLALSAAAVAFTVQAAQALAAPTHAAANIKIGYTDPLASEEGLRGVGWGEKQAIKALKLPWSLKETDANLSSDQQVSDIDTMISLGVKGLTSWTIDPGAADAAYKRARRAGIFVIGLNSSSKYFNTAIAAHTDTTCIVSKQQAAFIAQKIPHAKVLAIGGPPVPSITLTTNCFLAAAKKAGLTVVAFQKAQQGSQSEGQSIGSSMLLKHADAQAVWCFTEGLALGVSAALRSNNKSIWSGDKKGVVLVARNGTSAAAEAIKTGNLTATWDNNQPLVGAAAVQVLKYLLVDKASPSKLPKRIPIPSKRWDASNIKKYASPVSRKVPLPLPVSFKAFLKKYGK
jgi:ABC-type sugar transport system substrate-binding protein